MRLNSRTIFTSLSIFIFTQSGQKCFWSTYFFLSMLSTTPDMFQKIFTACSFLSVTRFVLGFNFVVLCCRHNWKIFENRIVCWAGLYTHFFCVYLLNSCSWKWVLKPDPSLFRQIILDWLHHAAKVDNPKHTNVQELQWACILRFMTVSFITIDQFEIWKVF